MNTNWENLTDELQAYILLDFTESGFEKKKLNDNEMSNLVQNELNDTVTVWDSSVQRNDWCRVAEKCLQKFKDEDNQTVLYNVEGVKQILHEKNIDTTSNIYVVRV